MPDDVKAWAVKALATAADGRDEQRRAKVLKVLEQEHRMRLAAAEQLEDRLQPRVDVAIERARDTEFEILLSQFVIELRLPFSIVDMPSYRKLFDAAKRLPVGYQHCNRHTVSNKLVPAECKRVQNGVGEIYAGAGVASGAIAADGATILHHSLLAIMILLPDLAPIVEQIEDASAHIAAGGTKDADYQADLMKVVIRKVGKEKIILGIFDGAGDIQGAGRRLTVLFPWMSSMWCIPHLCAVIFKHIAEHEWFQALLQNVNHILHHWHGPHFTTCLLREECEKWGEPGLYFIPDARFGCQFMAAHRQIAAKRSLRSATASPAYAQKDPADEHGVAALVRGDDHFRDCAAGVDLLWHLMLLLRRTDGNAPVLSKVRAMALRFEADLDADFTGRPAQHVPAGAVAHAKAVLNKYMPDLNKPITRAAYLVDPEFLEDTKDFGQDHDDMQALDATVDKLCIAWDITGTKKDEFKVDLSDGLDDFRQKKGTVFSKSFVWLDAARKPPHIWWRKWGSGALKRVAVALTGLRAGAGAVEHCWKKHKQSATKIRNRMAPEKAAALTYARINKRVIDGAASMDDPALGWTKDDAENRPGSEQRGGGPAAAEKPIFVDAFAEGEEVMTVTHDEASETWLRDKYKGIKFVDKDVEPEEHRTVFCLKWIRGRRSGPLARRVQRGWYVVSIMDAGRRQAPRRRRRRRPVQRGLPHRRGPLADDPGLGRDASQVPLLVGAGAINPCAIGMFLLCFC